MADHGIIFEYSHSISIFIIKWLSLTFQLMHPISLYKHGNHLRKIPSHMLHYICACNMEKLHVIKYPELNKFCMPAKLTKLKLIENFVQITLVTLKYSLFHLLRLKGKCKFLNLWISHHFITTNQTRQISTCHIKTTIGYQQVTYNYIQS